MAANFQDDLAYSHAQSDQPFWGEVYRQAFPDMETMSNVRKDCLAQRGGIDRIILTKSGRVWTIDEKARRKVYDDILLEYVSNDRTQAPGWVVKELMCDFIAYAQVPVRKCFLLPVLSLQRAWQLRGKHWLEIYGTRTAWNNDYCTLNCPVPYSELMRRMSEAMFFTWQDNQDVQPVPEAPELTLRGVMRSIAERNK